MHPDNNRVPGHGKGDLITGAGNSSLWQLDSTEETPRKFSFGGHAILGNEFFEVRNARRDPRFRDNPLVIGQPHIRFYAGAPLEATDGHKLGTLCIIDKVPRQLSDEAKTMLKNLADMVVSEMFSHSDAE